MTRNCLIYLAENLWKLKLNSKEVDEALKTAVLEINDNNTFEYYYDPGIPHRIEAIREMTMDINKEKLKRLYKIMIELIYNELNDIENK